jgi:histidinol-phosphate aminotransferase
MRADLVALEEYASINLAELERDLGHPLVKLDANENPYGPSPLVREALAACCAERYPDAACSELREGLGEYLGVDPAGIICSSGGDEMLDLLLRLFVDPGDEVIDCTPSFVMYALSTVYNRGTVVPVPRDERWAVDVAAVERALSERTKLIFVCSPNNPTGNSTPRDDVLRLLETGRVVVLDEAYVEFAGRTLVDLSKSYPNLVVMRTMSKWAALAGLRLGYAVVDPMVAVEMNKIKSPYNVGAAAQVAGIASLQDRDYLMTNVGKILEERERLYRRLQALGLGTVYPSETNFLYWVVEPLIPPAPRPTSWVPRWKRRGSFQQACLSQNLPSPLEGEGLGVRGEVVPAESVRHSTENRRRDIQARDLREVLRRRGVLVRLFEEPVGALRISVGTPQESDLLMAALEDAFAELAG